MTRELRLFVAAYPPLSVAESLLALLPRAELPAHRTVRADQVHLTLQFIGPAHPRELDGIIESVTRAAAGLPAIELLPTRLIPLPDARRARLIASELSAPPALVELKRRLAHRLSRRSRPEPADRFLPHMTLCRFAPGGALGSAELPAVPDAQPFRVDAVLLMNSTLRPTGAEHAELARAALEG